MSSSLKSACVEIRIPDAKTEQKFLLLAVQAAAKKYRETHPNPIHQPDATHDEAYSLELMAERFKRSIQHPLG